MQKILLIILGIIVAAVLLFGGALYNAAHGKNWDDDPSIAANIKTWYTNAQPNESGRGSCCGEADAYWADDHEIVDGNYIVTITDERNIQGRIPRNGQKIVIPSEKIDKKMQGNPTGHTVVFINTSHFVLCFFPDWGAWWY